MRKEIYDGIIDLSSKELSELEAAKKDTAFTSKEKNYLIANSIFCIGSLLSFVSMYTKPISILLFIFIIISIVIYVILLKAKFGRVKKFKLLVKEVIISKMFEKNFDAVKYYPEQGFDESFIFSQELVESGNIYESNDLMTGSYKGVGFMQADVHIQDVRKSGKSTVVVELFEGRWIIVDFFKDFAGEHQVRRNQSIFKNSKPFNFLGRRLKSVKFEDSEFTKVYNTVTSNEQEAFYLMTPRLMQNMLDYQNITRGEILFGFRDKKLHIAINDDSNAFELDGNDITKAFLEKVQHEIDVIKFVIDQLNLDNDLYKD